ncbi:MAG: hypothetical protein WBB64_04480, partial [Anaerolineales bacterium]
LLLFVSGGLMLVSGLGLLKYRKWASWIIAFIFCSSGINTLLILGYVRDGIFDIFSETYSSWWVESIVISGPVWIITALVGWYVTRPVAKEILED